MLQNFNILNHKKLKKFLTVAIGCGIRVVKVRSYKPRCGMLSRGVMAIVARAVLAARLPAAQNFPGDETRRLCPPHPPRQGQANSHENDLIAPYVFSRTGFGGEFNSANVRCSRREPE